MSLTHRRSPSRERSRSAQTTSLSGWPATRTATFCGRSLKRPGTIYEFNPTTGAVIESAPDDNQGLNEQDLGYLNNELYVSDTNGLGNSGGTNQIDVYNADTLTLVRSMPVNVQGFISGLAADGLGSAANDTDYYQFTANKGNKLVINLAAPGGNALNPGQFPNSLAPAINLYDPNGNLVASNLNAGLASSVVLNYTALLTGNYRVQIVGANDSLGEYILQVKGSAHAAAAVRRVFDFAGERLVRAPVHDGHDDLQSRDLPAESRGDDLLINGVPATDFTVVNANTVTWTLPSSAFIPGYHIKQNITFNKNALFDVSNTGLSSFSAAIYTNTVPPAVVKSSITEGEVLPAGSLSEVVTFNHAMDTIVHDGGELRSARQRPRRGLRRRPHSSGMPRAPSSLSSTPGFPTTSTR